MDMYIHIKTLLGDDEKTVALRNINSDIIPVIGGTIEVTVGGENDLLTFCSVNWEKLPEEVHCDAVRTFELRRASTLH